MAGDISLLLKQRLLEEGASLVGFGDISELTREKDADMKYGVSIAVCMTSSIVKNIKDGPTEEYYGEYKRLNTLLNKLVTDGAELLKSNGFKAFAQTISNVKEGDNFRTLYPHKSVATRSGIGWIGKCALLVTKEYGPAVRLSSILTDAPLEIGEPINASRCNSCRICADACPAKAATGEGWVLGKDRDEFFNAALCRQKARERSAKIGIEATICGKCIEVCPYTQKYINGK